MSLPPDEEKERGFHTDIHYPGLIKSVWRRGAFRLTRERKYLDRTNQNLKSEAWIVSFLPGDGKRFGLKFERDV